MHFYGRVCQVGERFRVALKRVGSGMTRPKEELKFLSPDQGGNGRTQQQGSAFTPIGKWPKMSIPPIEFG